MHHVFSINFFFNFRILLYVSKEMYDYNFGNIQKTVTPKQNRKGTEINFSYGKSEMYD
jgi:hypothetical protein